MNYTTILSLMIVGLLFEGCSSVSRFNFEEKFDNTLDTIIYYASLAGNSHNTQPWYVVIEDELTIRIEADFSRKLHIVDPDARGLFISIGAFIENFEIAAGAMGYDANIVITAKHNKDSSIATIKLTKANKSGYNLDKLANRRTIRTPFRKTEISTNHLNAMIGNNQKNIHFFPSNSDEGKYIALNTLAAYSRQANDDQAKQELAGWMRFSNADVKQHRDGLTTSGMGITGIGGFFVRNFFKPEDSMKDSFIKTGIDKTKQQVENCGGWIMITQSEDTPELWINTGRLYERLNIECREFMIGFHPMNQIIEEEEYEKEVNQYLSLPGKIQFVARIGYVDDYPPANSVRRPIQDIIKK